MRLIMKISKCATKRKTWKRFSQRSLLLKNLFHNNILRGWTQNKSYNKSDQNSYFSTIILILASKLSKLFRHLIKFLSHYSFVHSPISIDVKCKHTMFLIRWLSILAKQHFMDSLYSMIHQLHRCTMKCGICLVNSMNSMNESIDLYWTSITWHHLNSYYMH